MPLRRLAVLALLLLTACAPEKMVFTDDEVPLAAPLEAEAGAPVGGGGLELDDPPSRVVRLNYVAGAVSRQPAGLDDWAPAAVNHPLGVGDNLWVAPDGQAELHAGATDLRLGQGTGLDLLRLDNRALQLGLPRGELQLRIFPGQDEDSVEVDTPTGAVLLERPGTYRVDVDPEGGTDRVTVRSGQAEVTAAGATVPVHPGSTLELSGGAEPRYDVVEARDPDRFDQWCAGRDQREDRSQSAIYVGRGTIGYEDLDEHGSWRIDNTYGTVWVPRVPAGWAPYRDGHWVWTDPWGWTWVDAASWGFAPTHYGRWAYLDGAWAWVPHAGSVKSVRPVYAPALVAFVGGRGFRVAKSPGPSVAWIPLAPREPYLPAYPTSQVYVRNLNVANQPVGTPAAGPGAAAHANLAVADALTAVPLGVFTRALPVAAARFPVREPVSTQGLRVGSAPALTPRRESVLAASQGTPAASRPPAADAARPLMVRRMPLIASAFAARQQALAARHGRPLALPVLAGLRGQGPGVRTFPVRMVTLPGPGGSLRPERPGLPPALPFGSRTPLPPFAGQPRSQPLGPAGRPGLSNPGGFPAGNLRRNAPRPGAFRGQPRGSRSIGPIRRQGGQAGARGKALPPPPTR